MLQPKVFHNARNVKYNNAKKQVTSDYAKQTIRKTSVQSRQHLPMSHMYPPSLVSPPSIQIAMNGSVSPSD